MATLTAPPGAAPPPSTLRSREGTGRRRFKSALATVLIVLTFVVALVPLVLVVAYIVSKGIGVISWDFLTGDISFSTRFKTGGIGPAIVGSVRCV